MLNIDLHWLKVDIQNMLIKKKSLFKPLKSNLNFAFWSISKESFTQIIKEVEYQFAPRCNFCWEQTGYPDSTLLESSIKRDKNHRRMERDDLNQKTVRRIYSSNQTSSFISYLRRHGVSLDQQTRKWPIFFHRFISQNINKSSSCFSRWITENRPKETALVSLKGLIFTFQVSLLVKNKTASEPVCYLEVSHHDETSGADPARGKACRVQDAVLVPLDDVGVTQQADQYNWKRQTVETKKWRIRTRDTV